MSTIIFPISDRRMVGSLDRWMDECMDGMIVYGTFRYCFCLSLNDKYNNSSNNKIQRLICSALNFYWGALTPKNTTQKYKINKNNKIKM